MKLRCILLVRHALEEVRRGPNEASRKMMRYWHAQREREVQRDSGGDRRDTLRCGKKSVGAVLLKQVTNLPPGSTWVKESIDSTKQLRNFKSRSTIS